MKNLFHIGYHKTAYYLVSKKFYPFLENYIQVGKEVKLEISLRK